MRLSLFLKYIRKIDNRSIVLLIFSFLFIGIGIVFLDPLEWFSYDDHLHPFQKDVRNIKNYCILRITDYKKKHFFYFTNRGELISEQECKNSDLNSIPILSLIRFSKGDIAGNLKFKNFFDGWLYIFHKNPDINPIISEIKLQEGELQLFLNRRKIRIDIKNYVEKKWEKKLISLVIWLIHKNVKKAYLDIREDDALLIFDGEL